MKRSIHFLVIIDDALDPHISDEEEIILLIDDLFLVFKRRNTEENTRKKHCKGVTLFFCSVTKKDGLWGREKREGGERVVILECCT